MTHLAGPSRYHQVLCCCSDDEVAQTELSDDITPFEDSYFQKYCSSRLGTCLLQAIHKSNFKPSSLLHYYYSSYEKKDGRQLKMMAQHLTSAELCHPCYYATIADSKHLNS
jgi:hypothetical protein